ncbi:hypothetical protein l11_21480 [Neisseria weaveri LMG 5135]|nr:hypothetical protein l11_21480 [Neisseria weaveri LMG 5135]
MVNRKWRRCGQNSADWRGLCFPHGLWAVNCSVFSAFSRYFCVRCGKVCAGTAGGRLKILRLVYEIDRSYHLFVLNF